jgi:hypothetical protein
MLKFSFAFLMAIAISVPALSSEFVHPGMLNTRTELDFIKSKIIAGAEPWKTAFKSMHSSSYARLTWTPTPWDTVNCGSYSVPDSGCSAESNDAKAAYTHALLWYFTDSAVYAQKSIQILDAWAATIKAHTNSNAPLQAAWTASLFPLAAEILRATYPQWTGAEISQFSTMLTKTFLPLIINGKPTTNGNWELTMTDALLCIGVFNEDTAAFNKGIFLWRKRVPAYFYMSTDGSTPVRPYGTNNFASDSAITKYWYTPGQFADGLCQETCRDFGHTQMGLAAAINTAEIAYHQGTDLYAENDKRIMTAMEFHAAPLLGHPKLSWLCGDSLTGLKPAATWEIAYNHFHNRKGYLLPLSDSLILVKIRPSTTGTHMAWESLTHAELGEQAEALTGGSIVAAHRTAIVFIPNNGNCILYSKIAGTGEVAAFSLNGRQISRSMVAIRAGEYQSVNLSLPRVSGLYFVQIRLGAESAIFKYFQ